jgi:hypothetical protein
LGGSKPVAKRRKPTSKPLFTVNLNVHFDGIEEIADLLRQLVECKHHTLRVPLGPFTEQQGEVPDMATQSITINDNQDFTLGPVTGVDKKGNPAALGGPVTFVSSDPAKVAITDNGDGTAKASAVGGLTSAGSPVVITVSDTVDVASVEVSINSSAEVGLAVALGTPTDQAAAPAPVQPAPPAA